MVYTLPQYARVANRGLHSGRSGRTTEVYFAYDPYACYTGWDPVAVAAGERDLLTHCAAAFAISPALAEDFRKRTSRPVFVQPNGVSEIFLAAFDGPLPPPDDLPAGGPPVVGCVGQISRAYDWDLIRSPRPFACRIDVRVRRAGVPRKPRHPGPDRADLRRPKRSLARAEAARRFAAVHPAVRRLPEPAPGRAV